MSYTKPLPRLDTLNTPFSTAAKEGKFMLQFCEDCGNTRFPPGPLCPKCLSSRQSWKRRPARAHLESGVDFHRVTGAGSRANAYRACLVRLEEGRWWSATLWTTQTIFAWASR